MPREREHNVEIARSARFILTGLLLLLQSSSHSSNIRVFRRCILFDESSPVIEGDVSGQIVFHNNKHHMTLSLAGLEEEKNEKEKEREAKREASRFFFRSLSFLLSFWAIRCYAPAHIILLFFVFFFFPSRTIARRQREKTQQPTREKKREREREKERSTKAI